MVMIVQLRKFTKSDWTIHLKGVGFWYVNYTSIQLLNIKMCMSFLFKSILAILKQVFSYNSIIMEYFIWPSDQLLVDSLDLMTSQRSFNICWEYHVHTKILVEGKVLSQIAEANIVSVNKSLLGQLDSHLEKE